VYFDIHRFRWLPITLIVVPIVLIVAIVVLVSMGSTPTPSAHPPTTLATVPGHGRTTTTARHTTVTLPRVSPATENLAARKAAVLASEVSFLSHTGHAFATRFVQITNKGPAPHYKVVTSLGGFAKYPGVVKLSVLGSSQVICLELSIKQFSPLPAAVVSCP
jgi:hypothetical protein